jgi:hypothetical protein
MAKGRYSGIKDNRKELGRKLIEEAIERSEKTEGGGDVLVIGIEERSANEGEI